MPATMRDNELMLLAAVLATGLAGLAGGKLLLGIAGLAAGWFALTALCRADARTGFAGTADYGDGHGFAS